LEEKTNFKLLKMNPEVDLYLRDGCGRCSLYNTPQCKVHTWQAELKALRRIMLDCGLTEEIKWSMPTYTFQGNNLLIVSAFKEYASINFFKGALLSDPEGILIQPTENTQATRIVKFTNVQEVIAFESVLKNYVFEAIEVEKAGLKVALKKITEFAIPEELQQKFDEIPTFKTTFEALTSGRQRGYLLHFSAPKQSKTRVSRIEQALPQIYKGKGMQD
jgi:uncharacterized protein YdeI (YjbR/CyaY-like superfamily)